MRKFLRNKRVEQGCGTAKHDLHYRDSTDEKAL